MNGTVQADLDTGTNHEVQGRPESEEDGRGSDRGSEEQSSNGQSTQRSNRHTLGPGMEAEGRSVGEGEEIPRGAQASRQMSIDPPTPAGETDEKEEEDPEAMDMKLYLNHDGGLSGLANIGNTCFLNASLQALVHCPPIVGMFLTVIPDLARFKYSRISPRMELKFRLVEEFIILIRKIWSGRFRVCAPKELYRNAVALNASFRGFGQHDSQEFIRCLLNNIHDALMIKCDYDYKTNRKQGDRTGLGGKKDENGAESKRNAPPAQSDQLPKSKPPPRPTPTEFSIISDLFEGTLRSDVKCSNCGNVSTVCENFLDLSLEIPKDTHLKKVQEERGNGAMTNVRQGLLSSFTNMIGLTSPPLSLETLLHTFCTSSDLNHHNQYRCEKCKQKVDANKVLSITRLPEVLCIHIKRFSYHMYGSKVGRHVLFELSDLDMRPYLHHTLKSGKSRNINTKYDLFGVVRHSGGLSGGHYTAYAKSHVTGHWYNFDDRQASRVSPETVKDSQAYILMYVRKPRAAFRKSIVQSIERAVEEHLDPSKPSYLVAMYWKRKCLYTSNPGPIDNRILCCGHGIPLAGAEKSNLAFHVSPKQWEALYKKYSGGPVIRTDVKRRCRLCENHRIRLREKRAIIMLERRCREEGTADGWYIIDESWMKTWRDFIYGGENRPGPITNGNLFTKDGKLKADLEPAKHYRGLREPVWRELETIYGGGPEIVRKKILIYAPDYSPQNPDLPSDASASMPNDKHKTPVPIEIDEGDEEGGDNSFDET